MVAVSTSRRRRQLSLETTLLCALIALVILVPPAVTLRQGEAISLLYERTTRSFQGHDLRTRGYLDDFCLGIRFVPCLTFVTRQYREEGTAQALAIAELERIKTHWFAPLVDANADPVQWEVAGRTDPDPSADVDDAGANVDCPRQ